MNIRPEMRWAIIIGIVAHFPMPVAMAVILPFAAWDLANLLFNEITWQVQKRRGPRRITLEGRTFFFWSHRNGRVELLT